MSRLLSDTWLLLTLRWQMTWNGFRSRTPLKRALSVLFGVAFLGAAGAGTAVLGRLFGLLLRRYPDVALEGLLPGIILTAITLILLLSSFGVALGSLFLSSDLELLMAAPVDRRAVFISKILDGMGWYYTITATLALPALFFYGSTLAYGPLYYVLATLTVLGAPLLPASLGAVLVVIVARFAPARRVREVLGLFAALVGVSCSLVGQTSRVWGGRLREIGLRPESAIEDLQNLAAVPVPSLVAGRGLAAAGTGDWVAALANVAGFFALTFGVFAGCVLLADSMYVNGWVRMQSSGSARRSRARAAREASRAGWLGRAPAALAIALKDWRVIPRDLRNFAQLLTPLIILPAVYVNLLSASSRRGQDRLNQVERLAAGVVDSQGIFVAMGILSVCVLIFGRIASTSISREGKAWWLLKAAPITARELLGGKLLAAAVPYFLLSTLLLAGAAVWLGFSPLGTLYGWLGIELIGIGMLAIGVACGVPWARLDWDDPRRMGLGWGAVVSSIVSFLFALVVGLLLCLPLFVEAYLPAYTPTAWVLAVGGAVVLSVGTVALSMQFGGARLPAVGEA